MKGTAMNPVGCRAYEAVLKHKQYQQYIFYSSATADITQWELESLFIALMAPGRAMRRVGKAEFAMKLLALDTCRTCAEIFPECPIRRGTVMRATSTVRADVNAVNYILRKLKISHSNTHV
jgi:hypothetical protein